MEGFFHIFFLVVLFLLQCFQFARLHQLQPALQQPLTPVQGFFLVMLYLLQCFKFARHHRVQPPLQQPRNPAEGFFLVVLFWLQFVQFARLQQLQPPLQQPLNPLQVEILSDDDEDQAYIVELPNSDESNPDDSASSSSNQSFLSAHSDIPDLILSPSPFPNQTQEELEDLIYDLIHGHSPFPPHPPNNQSFLRRFLGCFCKPSTSS